MCKVGLKLAQWFWRRLLNVVNVFSLCRYNLPLEKSKPSIWTNLNPHHPGMRCDKFCWNWPRCSGDFFNLSMNYFAISLSSPPGKRHGPSFSQIWMLINQECFIPNFGWNWPYGFWEEDENVKSIVPEMIKQEEVRWQASLAHLIWNLK